MKISSLPWLIVPGMGQVRGGAPGLGVLIFVLFVASLNGCFLSSFLTAREDVPFFLGIAGVLLWLISLVDGARRLAKERS